MSAPPRLKARREFLAAAKARKQVAPGFILQARARAEGELPEQIGPRIGFTASKKVGGAVVRNRAKRRLRALADALLPKAGRSGWDYVLIARAKETASRDFELMGRELANALERIHAPRKKPAGGRKA